jgi:hypothetical protein
MQLANDDLLYVPIFFLHCDYKFVYDEETLENNETHRYRLKRKQNCEQRRHIPP